MTLINVHATFLVAFLPVLSLGSALLLYGLGKMSTPLLVFVLTFLVAVAPQVALRL